MGFERENPTGENYVIPQPTFNKNFEILSQDIGTKWMKDIP